MVELLLQHIKSMRPCRTQVSIIHCCTVTISQHTSKLLPLCPPRYSQAIRRCHGGVDSNGPAFGSTVHNPGTACGRPPLRCSHQKEAYLCEQSTCMLQLLQVAQAPDVRTSCEYVLYTCTTVCSGQSITENASGLKQESITKASKGGGANDHKSLHFRPCWLPL